MQKDNQAHMEPDRHMIWLCRNYSPFTGHFYSVEKPREEFEYKELFELPEGIHLDVQDGMSPRFFDNLAGKYLPGSELISVCIPLGNGQEGLWDKGDTIHGRKLDDLTKNIAKAFTARIKAFKKQKTAVKENTSER